MRHLVAAGDGAIGHLDDLRAPMDDILGAVKEQLSELQRYRALFGPLEAEKGHDGVTA